jgi:hypothetical protein
MRHYEPSWIIPICAVLMIALIIVVVILMPT